ncbi:hypothetical protein ES705_13389 [subsurface metagenome]
MKTFSIEGGETSPTVHIDESKSVVEISGNSTLKETSWFYSNLLKWILAFNLGNRKTEVINIKLRRINDSSSKWILLILRKLASLIPASEFEINWYIIGNSNRVLLSGQRLRSQSGCKVNLVSE